MTLPRGTIEILEEIQENGPCCFSDIEGLEVEGSQLSSATVTERLKELQALEAVEKNTMRLDTGRKTDGYEVTERGSKLIDLAEEFRQKLEDLE